MGWGGVAGQACIGPPTVGQAGEKGECTKQAGHATSMAGASSLQTHTPAPSIHALCAEPLPLLPAHPPAECSVHHAVVQRQLRLHSPGPQV